MISNKSLKMKHKLWAGLSAFFIVICLLIAATAKWMITDEPLSASSKKHLKTDLLYHPDTEQHPYFAFLGVNAKDQVDADVLGRYRYHQEWANYIQNKNALQQPEIDQGLNQNLTRADLSDAEKQLLHQLQQDLNQASDEFEHRILGNKTVLQKLIKREAIPLKRLSGLLQQNQYVSLVLPLQAASPNYSYIRHLQILTLANIELNAADQLSEYRAQFQQAHDFTQNRLSLIEKMLMQNWMSQMIDQIRREQLRMKVKTNLKALSSEQLSLHASLENELATQYLVTQYLAPFYVADGKNMSWVYLPNKTFNAIAEQNAVYWSFSAVPYTELEQKLGAIEHPVKSKWRLKNSVGHILSQVSEPNYERYMVMTQALNNKIFAFNALNTGELDIAQLNQNAEGRQYFEKQGKLCVEIPYPENEIAALNLKIDSCVKI